MPFSCNEKCYRFRADGGLVTFITEPCFLAKNQKPKDLDSYTSDSYPSTRAFGRGPPGQKAVSSQGA